MYRHWDFPTEQKLKHKQSQKFDESVNAIELPPCSAKIVPDAVPYILVVVPQYVFLCVIPWTEFRQPDPASVVEATTWV